MAAHPLQGNVVGNYYDKYASKNPIERALMRGFLQTVTGFYERMAPVTVLEVGCGEGRLAQHLVTTARRPQRFVACDLELGAVASGLDPIIELQAASIYELPFPRGPFGSLVWRGGLGPPPRPGARAGGGGPRGAPRRHRQYPARASLARD